MKLPYRLLLTRWQCDARLLSLAVGECLGGRVRGREIGGERWKRSVVLNTTALYTAHGQGLDEWRPFTDKSTTTSEIIGISEVLVDMIEERLIVSGDFASDCIVLITNILHFL